jgi:multidrug efflux pump subunit AcrA (membrane-fusion protein)
LACAAVTLSAALISSLIVVETWREYPGVLRNARMQSDLRLPASVPLKELLVQEGDKVAAGQTLAVYDTVLLAELLAASERRILADNIQRKCLTARSAPQPLELDSLEAEAGLMAERAIAECQALLNRHSVQASRITLALDTARDQSEQRIARLKVAAARQDDPALRHRIAVQIALEGSTGAARESRLKLEEAALRSDQEQELLERLKSLEEAVAQQRRRRAALSQAVAEPRLHAPFTGEVARMRSVALGQSHPQPVTLLSLRATGQSGLTASFTLPEGEAGALAPGDLLVMRMNGARNRPVEVQVPVTSIEPMARGDQAGRRMRVHLSVKESDLSGTEAPGDTKGLPGTTAASEVRVAAPPRKLSAVLFRAAAGLLPAWPEL